MGLAATVESILVNKLYSTAVTLTDFTSSCAANSVGLTQDVSAVLHVCYVFCVNNSWPFC